MGTFNNTFNRSFNQIGSNVNPILEPIIHDFTVTAITDVTMTIRAFVNPNDAETTVSLFHGVTEIPLPNIPVGDTAVLVTYTITGLLPYTNYSLRLEATNLNGTTVSNVIIEHTLKPIELTDGNWLAMWDAGYEENIRKNNESIALLDTRYGDEVEDFEYIQDPNFEDEEVSSTSLWDLGQGWSITGGQAVGVGLTSGDRLWHRRPLILMDFRAIMKLKLTNVQGSFTALSVRPGATNTPYLNNELMSVSTVGDIEGLLLTPTKINSIGVVYIYATGDITIDAISLKKLKGISLAAEHNTASNHPVHNLTDGYIGFDGINDRLATGHPTPPIGTVYAMVLRYGIDSTFTLRNDLIGLGEYNTDRMYIGSNVGINEFYQFDMKFMNVRTVTDSQSSIDKLNEWFLREDHDVPMNPGITLNAPTGLRVLDVTQTTLTLVYSAPSNNVEIVGYDVYNGETLAETVTGLTASITGLTANTQYNFTVIAKDADGNVSEHSNVKTITTLQIGEDDPNLLKFFITADFQLNQALGNGCSNEQFYNTIAYREAEYFDAGIDAGDWTEYPNDDVCLNIMNTEIISKFGSKGLPTFQVIGNHDGNNYKRFFDGLDPTYTYYVSPTSDTDNGYYHVYFKNIDIFLLQGHITGDITQGQQDWIASELAILNASGRTDIRIITVCHGELGRAWNNILPKDTILRQFLKFQNDNPGALYLLNISGHEQLRVYRREYLASAYDEFDKDYINYSVMFPPPIYSIQDLGPNIDISHLSFSKLTWDENNKLLQLNGYGVSSIKFELDFSDTPYSNFDFSDSKTLPSDSLYGADLIVNTDFNNGFTGWEDYELEGNETKLIGETAVMLRPETYICVWKDRLGGSVVYLRTNHADEGIASTPFPVTAGKTYEIEVRVYILQGSLSITNNSETLGLSSDGVICKIDVINSAFEYKTIKSQKTVTSDYLTEQIRIVSILGGSGAEWYIDYVRVREVL